MGGDLRLQFQVDAAAPVAEAQPIGLSTGHHRAARVESATTGDAARIGCLTDEDLLRHALHQVKKFQQWLTLHFRLRQ